MLDKAGSGDKSKLIGLAATIDHEVEAHAAKDAAIFNAKRKSPIGKDHAEYYNDNSLLGTSSSPDDSKVKPNSRAGEVLKKLRNVK